MRFDLHPQSGRAQRAALALAFALGVAAPAGAPAASRDGGPPTQLLTEIYLNGIARMAKGNPRRAIPVFRLVADVAPDVPEASYQLALAIVIGDFGHRDQALPALDRALAAEPAEPLFAIVRIFADPAESVLRSDGGLYLSADAAERLRNATAQLPAMTEGYNARYLIPVLTRIEPTQDPQFPFRLAAFAQMIGDGATIHLPQLGDVPQPFGRLFAIPVLDSRFSPYEGRLIERLNGGLNGLVADRTAPPEPQP